VVREALAIQTKKLGREHPKVAMSLNNLSRVLKNEERPAEVEAVLRKANVLKRKVSLSRTTP